MASRVPLHRKEVVVVEATPPGGVPMEWHALYGDRAAQERLARERVASGDSDVAIITQEWVWRGKSGKVRKTEVKREPVSPESAGIRVVSGAYTHVGTGEHIQVTRFSDTKVALYRGGANGTVHYFTEDQMASAIDAREFIRGLL